MRSSFPCIVGDVCRPLMKLCEKRKLIYYDLFLISRVGDNDTADDLLTSS
jgi:hypothetical protein